MRGRECGPASFLSGTDRRTRIPAYHDPSSTPVGSCQESPVNPEGPELQRIRRAYCAAWRGVLLHGELVTPVRFVLDARSGDPVMPVPRIALEEESLTLFIPEERDDALQVMGPPVPIDPARHDACDRHSAYFGRPDHTHWIMIDVEGGRMGDMVFDGADLDCDNPLHADETALCRRLNADPVRLARLIGAPAATAVGVDRFGAHVRARFGIARLEFPREVLTVEEAARAIDTILGRDAP